MFLFGLISWASVALGDDVPEKCKYNPARDDFPGGKFPVNFGWSLATAAYQVSLTLTLACCLYEGKLFRLKVLGTSMEKG